MALFRRARRRRRQRRGEQGAFIRQLLYGTLAILVVVLLGVATWYTTRLPSVTITEVTVAGGETISHEMIRGKVEAELRGNYLLLVPHRFTYFYPHDRMVSAVTSVPRVHNVTIERDGRNTLNVAFDEYVPHALWCDHVEESARCLFLDRSGYAFAPAPPLRGGTFLRYVVSGTDAEVNTALRNPDALANLETLTDALASELGLRIGTVVFSGTHDADLRVHKGGTIRISLEMSTQDTFENLQSILSSAEFADIEPGNFNYIDLRFGNRVFVNEEIATSTDASVDETSTSSETAFDIEATEE